MTRSLVVVLAAVVIFAAVPPALAAPPPNDARAAAQALGRLPASGTYVWLVRVPRVSLNSFDAVTCLEGANGASGVHE